jgi:hypothetical protein
MHVLVFTALCLESFANLGKCATETLEMIRQALGEENMSCRRKVQSHRHRKEARQMNKAESMLIIYL